MRCAAGLICLDPGMEPRWKPKDATAEGAALAQSEPVPGFLAAETGRFVSRSRSNEIGARSGKWTLREIHAAPKRALQYSH